MESRITVSVIIPVYNDENNIGPCLDSVLLRQSLPGAEVICVDDGSTDGSGQILQDYQKRFSNVTVISQKNRGLSNARNRGLAIARGQYVYFVDSDDLLEEGMLLKAWQLCREKDLDVLFFSFESFGDTPQMNERYHKIIYDTKRKYCHPNKVLSGRDMFCLFCRENEYHVMVWVQIARREFLNRCNIRFCDGILFEDNLYTFLVLMNAQRTYCTNDIWYHKRIRENSIVTKPECPENIMGFLTTVSAEMEYIQTHIGNKNDDFRQCQEKVMKHLLQQIHKRYHRLSTADQQRLMQNCSAHEYLTLKAVLLLADGQLYQ